MERVIVVRHHDIDSAGFIADALEARGAGLSVHLFPDDGPLPAPGGADRIVVLGAVSSVNDPDPWIAEELNWLRAADQAGVPVLGICFGAQALCAAFGGQVEAMERREIGWRLVESADPDLVPPGPWLEFHNDRCLPPSDATVLARNDVAVQAFGIGRTSRSNSTPRSTGRSLSAGWTHIRTPTPRRWGSTPTSSWPTPSARSPPPATAPPSWSRLSCGSAVEAQPPRSGRSYSAVIVACMAANGRLAPSANASPRHTTRVRPARTTWPVIVNRCPAAGASRLMV